VIECSDLGVTEQTRRSAAPTSGYPRDNEQQGVVEAVLRFRRSSSPPPPGAGIAKGIGAAAERGRPIDDQTATPRREAIPAAHVARIRTWVKYGMPVPQVAAIYGAEVDEIVRILGKA
jgi:hypothetical protein